MDDQKLYEIYASSLSKAWESYIKIVDLLIGLSGATALVFLGSIKVADWTSLSNKHHIFYVFVFSAMSLIFSILWRFASQHFMEYETLGSKQAADVYFKVSEITPVSKAHSQSNYVRVFYRGCFKILPIPMGLSLIGAWANIFWTFFK